MGQIGPPKTVFYDAELAELEWVFQSVCSALDSAKALPNEADKGLFVGGYSCWLATG
jgi:hypothetical protein